MEPSEAADPATTRSEPIDASAPLRTSHAPAPRWPWEAHGSCNGAGVDADSEPVQRLLLWPSELPNPAKYAHTRPSDVNLVVIDGIAAMVAEDLAATVRSGSMRGSAAAGTGTATMRTREAFGLLARASALVRQLAKSYQVAVVITNSAVRSRRHRPGGPDVLQPALGAAWAHGIDTSI